MKKLSTSELLRRVDAGDTYAEIGNDHGITRQAVQKQVRLLRGKVTKATQPAGHTLGWPANDGLTNR